MNDGLLIDTNLLLLMIIGGIDEGRYIKKSKRLNTYCRDDYYNLWKLVEDYKEIWITPYIAAEVSNLIDISGEAGERIFALAGEIFKTFKQVKVTISDDCQQDFFNQFGLTDSSIINLSKKVHVITNDQRMLTPLYATSPDNIIAFIPSNKQ